MTKKLTCACDGCGALRHSRYAFYVVHDSSGPKFLCRACWERANGTTAVCPHFPMLCPPGRCPALDANSRLPTPPQQPAECVEPVAGGTWDQQLRRDLETLTSERDTALATVAAHVEANEALMDANKSLSAARDLAKADNITLSERNLDLQRRFNLHVLDALGEHGEECLQQIKLYRERAEKAEQEAVRLRAAIPATEEPVAKLDPKVCGELIAKVSAGIDKMGHRCREDAHEALDKLAAMLGAKEHTNAE